MRFITYLMLEGKSGPRETFTDEDLDIEMDIYDSRGMITVTPKDGLKVLFIGDVNHVKTLLNAASDYTTMKQFETKSMDTYFGYSATSKFDKGTKNPIERMAVVNALKSYFDS